MKKWITLLLATFMALSVAACGSKGNNGGEAPGEEERAAGNDENTFVMSDCVVKYKSACLMEDSEGNDAIVLTLDFTNNGTEPTCYMMSVDESGFQDGEKLELAFVYTDQETFADVTNEQYTDVQPGETIEVRSAFELKDSASEVEAVFISFTGEGKGSVKLDPSTLEREESAGKREDPGIDGDGSDEPAYTEEDTVSGFSYDELTDILGWWQEDWYGLWITTGNCVGLYEGHTGWLGDICARISVGTNPDGDDLIGSIAIWDESTEWLKPFCLADVSLSKDGSDKYGVMISEGGRFSGDELNHGEWTIDPALSDYENMICFDGHYEGEEGGFDYRFYLKHWGERWDDVLAAEGYQPHTYDDWYLPLIEAGETMPSAIGR